MIDPSPTAEATRLTEPLQATSHPEHVLQHGLDESRRKAARQKERRQERRASAGRTG